MSRTYFPQLEQEQLEPQLPVTKRVSSDRRSILMRGCCIVHWDGFVTCLEVDDTMKGVAFRLWHGDTIIEGNN